MEIRYIEYPSLKSTNSEAESLIREDSFNESTVIRSDYQRNGRGQGKNKWQSNKGENVLLSWIVFPAFLSVQDQFLLSKAVSLAITDYMLSKGIEAKIKWPNDIISNDKKLGGILIENRLLGSDILSSIIGIGLNINQEQFPDFLFPATSLSELAGSKFDIAVEFRQLMEHLIRRYQMLEAGGISELNNGYIEGLYRYQSSTTFVSNAREFEGFIQGVDEYGCLLIREGDQLHTFGFHEVKMKV